MTQFSKFITEGLIKLPEATLKKVIDSFAYWALAYAQRQAEIDSDELDRMMIGSVVKRLSGEFGVQVPTATDVKRATRSITMKIKMDDLPQSYVNRLKGAEKIGDQTLVFKILFGEDSYLGTRDSGYTEHRKSGEATVVISARNVLTDNVRYDLVASPHLVSRRIAQAIGTIEHEVTHAVQYLILGKLDPKQIQSFGDVKVAKKTATRDDKYYLSQIEFDPTVKSSIRDLEAKFKMLKSEAREERMKIINSYTWADSSEEQIRAKLSRNNKEPRSKFFGVLKLHDLTKWKKAVKLLMSNLT